MICLKNVEMCAIFIQIGVAMKIFLYILIGISVIALLSFIIYNILKSPFKYPYHIVTFDVSGKRSLNVNDLIDNHLNIYGFNEFSQHYESVKRWKTDCQERIKKSKLRQLRTQQFAKIIDDEHMFRLNSLENKLVINK